MAEKESLGTDQPLMPYERRMRESPADAKGLFAVSESGEPDHPAEADESTAPEGDEPEIAKSEEEAAEAESEEEIEGEEEPDEEEEKPAEDPVYEVKGERVTLQGLKDGYLREIDYRHKTQALADERRKVQSGEAELRSLRDQYAQRLEAVGQALKELAPAEQDWDRLEKEDPAKFNLEWARYQRHKAKRDAAEAEQRRVYEERAADFEKQQNAYLEEQASLLQQAIPEWKDPVRSKADREKLASYLTSTYGWTADDLATVQDHRLLLALRKSMLWDESQKNGKAKLADKIKPASQPLKPGAREVVPQRGRKREIRAQVNRLKQTGRVDDLAALIDKIPD